MPRRAYHRVMTALGIALVVIGGVAVVLETHIQSLGFLGVPGVAALAAGAVLTVAGLGGALALVVVCAVVLAATGAAVVALSLNKGVSVRRRRIQTGSEGIIGHLGVVRKWVEATGTVLIDGALWRARLSLPDEDPLQEGDHVVVERVNGLTLCVRKAENWELVA
jgi:membrane-bound serine protease (ClpP class)